MVLQKFRYASKIRRDMNKRGFSLIELLVVIAIIGILATVAVTAYIGTTKKAARSEAYSNLGSIRLLEEQFYAENATYAGPAANTAAITALLPGFRPGTGTSFTYAITNADGVGLPAAVPIPYDNSTAALVPVTIPCFIATATGIAGTRVCPDAANCDIFAIDCNNNRNF
jgi:prepilin-type N-terminal cleavage/methylation domain-containing protein